ncbi:NfeD family protein [Pseudomonas sp. GOM7]|uniref:NfeD family protein n=1 Tax=unclassified Pseudomonas TaxID=196821 RepID=UPI00227A33FA|nr:MULTISPECIES: NfeD family protein [unclassified Pseudomonas]WAJ37404.1 NfeD family protein [Pseudomonas sp. GOM7]
MTEYLHHLAFWDWLALATLLLLIEVFGAGGYLLWIGLAAVITSALTFLLGLSWAWQIGLFGLLAVVTALLWRSHQQRRVQT